MALIDRFEGTGARDDIDERRLSLGEHLEELRKHVFRAVGWFILAFVVSLCLQEPLMRVATWPHVKTMDELRRAAVTETAARYLGSGVASDVLSVLDSTDDLEKSMRGIARNSSILHEQLEKDPRARIEALAERRRQLATRVAALKADQEKLLGHM